MIAKTLSDLRVLHVLPFVGMGGGAPRAMLTTVAELQRRRPNFVLSLLDDEVATAARAVGAVAIPVFPHTWPRSRTKRLLGTIQAIRRAIRTHGINLLHSHSTPGLRYCLPAARLAGIPLLSHLRDIYTSNYFHAGLGFADHIVAISQCVHATLPPKWHRKTTVVHDAIDIPAEIPALSPAGGRIHVGMAGRCDPLKGHDLLLAAALPLLERFDFELHIWGLDDATELARQIRNTVAALPAETAARVHLEQYRLDMPAFYRSVDVIVVPSRVKEGFGLAAAEGLAWGKTVIAAGHGGLSEIVLDEQTGLQFKPHDALSLQQQLVRVLTDPALRLQLAAAGRESVQRFAVGPHADCIDAVYRHLCKIPASSPELVPANP